MSKIKFAVLGAGSIGLGWAIVFARSKSDVVVYDVKQEMLDNFWIQLRSRLALLASNGLLTEGIDTVASRISVTLDLSHAVSNVDYVQECVPEDLRLKQNIFRNLEDLSSPTAILASSSSALTATEFAYNLASNHRCLVVHPGNPPYLLSIAEVVPATFTSAESVESTMNILRNVGMIPVKISTEPKGFVFNRLQGAILREAYCLVRDGVISAQDLDLIVTEGLGKRWSITGPFATAALNVQGGIKAHAERMGKSYFEMGLIRGQNDPWEAGLIEQVSNEMESKLANENWKINTEIRDLALMKINKSLSQIVKP